MPDRSYLLRGLNDTAVAGYYKLMVESSVMLGAERDRAEKEMLDALFFETILANVSSSLVLEKFLKCCLVLKFSLPREERRNISLLYNKMTINDMSKLAPNVSYASLTSYINYYCF